MAGTRRRPGDQIVSPRSAWNVAEWAHTLLGYGGEPTSHGFTTDEREAVEERFGFQFASVHRAFLAMGLPRGPLWPNWRSGSARALRARLGEPVDGVVTDVLEHDFWPTRWGVRPAADDEREVVARAQLRTVPALVPLYGRFYLPAGDPRPDCPVLAVERTIVVRAGHDLAHFIGREFAMHDTAPTGRVVRVPFWSDLAELFDPDRSGPGIMEP